MSEMKNTLYGIKGRLLRKDVTWRHSKRNDPKWNTEKELKKNNRASVKLWDNYKWSTIYIRVPRGSGGKTYLKN